MTRTRLRQVWFSLLFAVAGCGPDHFVSLARQGEIDAHAPILATASIIIDADPAVVWEVLTDIRQWPGWQHDISATSIDDPPAPGVRFEWSIPGATIRSRIMLFEPAHRLAWVGSLFVFRAVHVWILHARPGGQTLIETRELMTGWPIGWIYSSADLLEADRRWLAALRTEIDRRAGRIAGQAAGHS